MQAALPPPSSAPSNGPPLATPKNALQANEGQLRSELQKFKHTDKITHEQCVTLFTFASAFLPPEYRENGENYDSLKGRIESLTISTENPKGQGCRIDDQLKVLEGDILQEKKRKCKKIIEIYEASKRSHGHAPPESPYLPLFVHLKNLMHLFTFEQGCENLRVKLIKNCFTAYLEQPANETVYLDVRSLLKRLKVKEAHKAKQLSIPKEASRQSRQCEEAFNILKARFTSLKDSLKHCTLTESSESEMNELLKTSLQLKKDFEEFAQTYLKTRKKLEESYGQHFKAVREIEITSLHALKKDLGAQDILPRIKFIYMYSSSPKGQAQVQGYIDELTQLEAQVKERLLKLGEILNQLRSGQVLKDLSTINQLKQTCSCVLAASYPEDSINKENFGKLRIAFPKAVTLLERLSVTLTQLNGQMEVLRQPEPRSLDTVKVVFAQIKQSQASVYALKQTLQELNIDALIQFLQSRFTTHFEGFLTQRSLRNLGVMLGDCERFLRLKEENREILDKLQNLEDLFKTFEKHSEEAFKIYSEWTSTFQKEHAERVHHLNNQRMIVTSQISALSITLVPYQALYQEAKEYLRLLQVILDSLQPDNAFTPQCLELIDQVSKTLKEKVEGNKLALSHIQSLMSLLRTQTDLVTLLKTQQSTLTRIT